MDRELASLANKIIQRDTFVELSGVCHCRLTDEGDKYERLFCVAR